MAKKKRGVMKLWLAILLSVVGLVAIAGTTVLVMYLLGNFKENVVAPENIAVETSDEFVEGLARFDAANSSLANQNNRRYHFNASSNFSIVISSTTENVTAKEITLSDLSGGQLKNGKLENQYIRIPQKAKLGEKIQIELLKDANLGDVFGGYSSFVAKSENPLLSAVRVSVSTDVSVREFSLKISGRETKSETGVEQVLRGEFRIEALFSPDKSQYNFSNSESEKRVFFSAEDTNLECLDAEKGLFRTKDVITASHTDRVTAYTFSNAFYQQQVLEEFSAFSGEDLATRVIQHLEQNPEKCKKSYIDIQVVPAEIDKVEFSGDDSTKLLQFENTIDKYFQLTFNSSVGDGSLNMSITDKNGKDLSSLFSQVGIKIPKGDDFKNLIILGGNVVKVSDHDGQKTISFEPFDSEKEYWNDMSADYYVLPNTAPSLYGNYYWQIADGNATARTCDLELNLFYQDDASNEWTAFFDFGVEGNVEPTLRFESSMSAFEYPPTWTQNMPIRLTINYAEDGKPKSDSINLKDPTIYHGVDANNVYKTVKFFLFCSDPATNLTEIFDCEVAKTYALKNEIYGLPHLEGNVGGNYEYTLYGLEGNFLTALKSCAKNIYVIAAIIRTDVNGKPVETETGDLQIVTVSAPLQVEVDNALPFFNLEPSFEFDPSAQLPQVGETGDYYIPSVYVDENGSKMQVIKFKMTLTSENRESDIVKIRNAFNSTEEGTERLRVVCKDVSNTETTDVVMQAPEVKASESDANQVIVTANFFIVEEAFVHGADRRLKFELQYIDKLNVEHEKSICKSDEPTVGSVVIYYPEVVAMKGEYESQNNPSLDKDGDGHFDEIQIVDDIEKATITWGNWTVSGNTLDEILNNGGLNSLLSFTLTDQHGLQIQEKAELYSVQFVEIPNGDNSPVLNFDSENKRIQSFNTSKNLTTTLRVRVIDSEGNAVKFEGEEIAHEFQFNVSCTGIDHIKYDDTTVDVDAATRESKTESFVPNEINGNKNNGSVKVTKFATVGVETRLSNLFDVFLDEAETKRVETLKFTLADSFYNGMSPDILKVFGFALTSEVEGGRFVNKTDTRSDYSSLRDAIPGEVFGIVFYGYIQSSITIEFNVTDESERLFNIQFLLVCQPCASLDSTFNKYSQGTYEGYLKTRTEDNRQPAIFANEKYSLDEYIPISWIGNESPEINNHPTWTSLLTGVDNLGTYFTCSSESVTLGVSGAEAGAQTFFLSFGDFYQLQTVQFTIFCGQSERYSLRTTITVFVNPNIVVVQKVPSADANMQVDLQHLDSNLFDVFRVTGDEGYVQRGNNAQSIKKDFTYSNITGTGLEYVTLTTIGGVITLGVNNNQLNMKLGEKILQTFVVQTRSLTGDLEEVDAVRVKVFGEDDEQAIEECGEATFAFDIGFGDNAYEMAQKLIKKGDGQNVETVVFNGKETIVLLSGKQYTVAEDFSVETVSGNLNLSEGNQINAKKLSRAFFNPLDGSEGNTIVVKTVLDGKLSVFISLNAIVSQIGEVFVKYDQDDGSFNKFGNVDFAQLVSASVNSLEENGVYQELKAGSTYKILHNIAKTDALDKDSAGRYLPGLYYYAEDEGEFNLTLSIVEDCVGYIRGLATLSNGMLTINDLKNGTDDNVFVVVRAMVSSVGKTAFYWNFRIKVQSNLEGGSVVYPYAEDVEYLDENSTYFADGGYHINLQEQFVDTNSRFSSRDDKKRFADPDFGVGRKVEIGYKIASARIGDSVTELSRSELQDLVESCSLELSGNESARVDSAEDFFFDIKLKDNLTRLTLEIAKFYYIDGIRALSSTDLSYVFKFNQSPTYKASVTTNGQALTGTNNVFTYSVKAGSGLNTFNITLSEISGTSENAEQRFFAYAKSLSGGLSNAINGGFEFVGENGSGVLTFTPQNSVARDSVVEFGIYTSKKVALKLIITVTGPYDITATGTELSGGRTYRISDLLTIKGIDGTSVGDNSVSVVCTNGAPTSYFVNLATAGLVGFANLLQDTTFNFDFTISGYSFTREFVVKASIDSGATYTHKDTEKRYGGKGFEFGIEDIRSDIPTTEDVAFTYKIYDGTEFGKTVSVMPRSVGEEQTISQTFTVACFNASNELFRITLIYNYTIYPNVQTKLHYPAPNGTELEEEEEFLSDNTTIEDFFGGKAEFNQHSRVEVSVVEAAEVAETNWRITVDANSISNLQLTCGEDKVVTSQSSTGELELYEGTAKPDLKLTFSLIDKSKTGSIDFVVSVNAVEKIYHVVVLTTKVIDLQLNSSSSTKERFYAEDLKKQEDAKIFARNRILKYAFNEETAAGGGDYFARLVSETEGVKAVPISAETSATVVKDLGMSYVGFTYQGTFLRREDAENLSVTQSLDSTIFSVAPQLTARVVAIYKTLTRNIEIDLENADYSITMNGEDSEQVQIDVTNWSKEITYTPKLLHDGKTIETSNFVYTVAVSLKYDIKVTSDSTDKDTTTIILEAGSQNVPFLATYAEQLGITDENGDTMTPQRLKEIGASFDIQIYGASIALKQNAGSTEEERKLTNNALSIHNRLVAEQYTSSTGLKYRYTTGLIPRAQCQLDNNGFVVGGGAVLTNRLNYITLSALPDGSDWTITAQGSNNNGNYVMLRLDYVVDLGGNNVARNSHNLLFKVEPNTTLTFASDAQSDTNTSIVASEYDSESDQLITSNRDRPYKVDFNLTNSPYDIEFAKIINVMLHGKTTNSASELTYTYKDSPQEIAGKTYNDKTDSFLNSLAGSGWEGLADNEFSSKGSKAVIRAKATSFGSANFFVEFEDEFEFKMRFYFTVISPSNPTLTGAGTISEGDILHFGARYTKLTQRIDTGKFMFVGSFKYAVAADESFKDTIPDSEKYNNYVKLTNNPIDLDNTGTSVTLRIVAKTKDKDYVHEFDGAKVGNKESKIFQVFYETEEEWAKELKQEDIETVEIWVLFEGDKLGAYSVEYGNNAKETEIPSGEEEQEYDAEADKDVTFENGVAKANGYVRNNREDTYYNTKKFYVSSTLVTDYRKSTISNPDRPNTDEDDLNSYSYVVLGGMDIVGFATDLKDDETTKIKAVNSANLTSTDKSIRSGFDINNLEVTQISFVVNNQTVDKTDNQHLRFVTSDQFSYYYDGDMGNGKFYAGISKDGKTENGNCDVTFTVPNFDGSVWGTQESINLTINFTLTYNGNSTTIPVAYSLIRKDLGKELFSGKTSIIDDEAVTFNQLSDVKVYNDTLEVRLDSKESVDLVILDRDAYAFEDNGELIYVKQKDESNDGNKSYYSIEGTTVQKKDFAEARYERFVPVTVSLSNQRSYTVREYVGINKNVQANGRDGMLPYGEGFYVLATNHKIAGEDTESKLSLIYNGESLEVSTMSMQYGGSTAKIEKLSSRKAIAEYSSANKLRINHIDELAGREYKTTQLFFLYSKVVGGETYTYRYEQAFNVYPQFVSARTNQLDNAVDVTSYIQAESSGSSTPYYMFPLASWGKDVILSRYNNKEETDVFSSNSNDDYKFKFEISRNSSLGYGQANIDARGLITTVEGFSLEAQKITVNVYMRVAGEDGKFESDDTSSTPLGTFTLHFTKSRTQTGLVTDIRRVGNSIFAVDSGELYNYNSNEIMNPDYNQVSSISETFTCEVGQTFDFENAFDEYFSKYTNKKYKLLKDGENAVVFNTSNIQDNVDSWRFDTSGKREVTIGLSARNSDGSSFASYFTATIIVQDNVRKRMSFAVASGETFNPKIKIDAQENVEWFKQEVSSSVAQSVSDSDTVPGEVGLHDFTYIQTSQDKSTSYDVSLYVYTQTESRFAAVQPGGAFDVQNLLTQKTAGSTYEFWKLDSNKMFTEVVRIDNLSENKSEGSIETRRYCLVEKNSQKQVISVKLFEVTFKYISTSISQEGQESITLDAGRILRLDVVSEKVKELLGISAIENRIEDYVAEMRAIRASTEFYSIQERSSSTGILTYVQDFEIPSGLNAVPRTYVVTYMVDGVLQVKLVQIYFSFL